MSGQQAPAGAKRRALVIAVALVVAAGGFAAFAGWSKWSADHDDSLRYANSRDDALRAGQQGIALFNTLDYRQVDEGVRRWLDASTGALRDEFGRMSESSKQQLAKAKSTTEGRVTDASVTELDDRLGRAKVIASVEIAVTPETGQPTTKRNRYQAELTRTDTGWKVSALGPVPVVTA